MTCSSRQKTRLLGFVALVAMLVMPGCATVMHQPVLKDADDKARGIRYYRSAPYLLVWLDGKGGLGWDIRMLPDQTQLMEARPRQFLALIEDGGDSGEGIVFKNGILISAESKGDATKVPEAIIKAAEAAVKALGPAYNVATDSLRTKQTELIAPRLYRIVITNAGVEFVGGNGQADRIFVGNAIIHGLDDKESTVTEGATK